MSARDDVVLSAMQGKRPNASGWVRVNCPFCIDAVGKDDRSASLGVHATLGFYSCFRCETKGRLRDYDGVEVPAAPEPGIVEHAEVELPEGFALLDEAWGSIVASPAVDYLCSRGVGLELATELEIGACFSGYYAERVVVPVFDVERRLVNWVARSWNKLDPMRYRYAPGGSRPLFNAEVLAVQTDLPVLAVEGVFDGFRYWPNVVSFLGKPTAEQRLMLRNARRPVVVVLDGDAWQLAEALAMELLLAGVRSDYVHLPAGRDPADAKTDPDDLWAQAVALVA